MASEIRVNDIKNRSGLGTVTFTDTGLLISGITSFSLGNTNLIVGSATSTGTASQTLQVTGGAYVSGNIGIGYTNPGAKLTVAGDLTLGRTDSVNEGGQINFNRSVDDATAYAIDVYGNTAANSRLRFIDSVAGAERVTLDRAGNFIVGTSSSTGTASQPLQVTGGAYVSGNLGIGTINPSSSLHVAGSRDNNPTQPGVHIGEGGANDFALDICCRNSSSSAYIDFTYPGQDYKGRIIKTMGSAFSIQNTEATPMYFYNNDGNKLIIDSSGRITMPSQVYVYAASGTRSGTPNPASPPHYPFTTYSESYDVGSNFNASTGVFTAPVTGKYLIMGTWSQDANTGRTIGTLSFNGNYEEWVESNNQYNDVTGARVRVLSANDTVSFGSQQAALAAIAISIWLLG